MTQKNIIFDLDGTLTDSGEGIINCAAMTLERFGLPVPSRQEMRVFVGPPLDQTFIKFGIPADRAAEAISIFRSRYVPVGIFENHPYPGIREMLDALKSHGHRLFVATSKPEEMALQVLNRFDLAQYFQKICGATMDGSRIEKSHVISYLMQQTGPAERWVMVGDTEYDVLGASHHGIPTFGVSWGYGQVEAMNAAGAVAIAHSPQELLALLDT